MIDYDQSLAMAIRRMEGGRAAFFQAIELAAESGDAHARAFLTCYRELRRADQQYVVVDLVCMAAGVNRTDLLKVVVGTLFDHHCEVASLVRSASHPAIVETAIASAKRLDSDIGQRDRHDLLLAAGFLPTPRGAVINVSAHAAAAAQAAVSANADPSVPDFLDDINEAGVARDTIEGQLAIEAPLDDQEV